RAQFKRKSANGPSAKSADVRFEFCLAGRSGFPRYAESDANDPCADFALYATLAPPAPNKLRNSCLGSRELMLPPQPRDIIRSRIHCHPLLNTFVRIPLWRLALHKLRRSSLSI